MKRVIGYDVDLGKPMRIGLDRGTGLEKLLAEYVLPGAINAAREGSSIEIMIDGKTILAIRPVFLQEKP